MKNKKRFVPKANRNKFIPAIDRKIDKLLISKEVNFIGKSADNLKLELKIMPNFSLVIF